MKRQRWVATVALLWSTAACNFTQGDCYPVGQGGASGDRGSGVIDSTGSGPSGDGLSGAQCNSPSDVNSAPAGPASSCTITNWGPQDGTVYDYCDSACVALCGSALGIGTFGPSLFKFVTTVPDDGTDVAGGWQVANPTLTFERWTGLLDETWTCKIAVGFPLRTQKRGVLSPTLPPVASADTANAAGLYLMTHPEGIPQGIFCALFPGQMEQELAASAYSDIGAKVTKQGAQ